MKKFFVLGAAVLLCLSLAAEVFAQNAVVTGTVSDTAGALIPGVEVTATNVDTGIVDTRISNETGSYNFASLQPGVYKLTATLPGFQTATYNEVRLGQGQQVRFNFEMKVGQLDTVVEVTSDARVTLATTTASVGDVLPSVEVTALPLADRSILGLEKTATGAVGDQFGGQRAIDLNVTRDGLVTTDQRFNQGAGTATFSSPDLIEEVQLIVGSIDSETGRGSGQIRLQTRSGTNQFRGALFYTDYNSAMNANNWFANLAGTKPAYLNRQQFGGRLGGPIFKKKTFFFVLYEGQRYLQKDSFTATTLTADARAGNFRYFNGQRNGNALSATPSVDLYGNFVRPASDLRSFNLFTDVRDPNRPQIDSSGYIQRVLSMMPLPNNWTVGDGLNTAGYNFRRRISGSGVAATTNRDGLNVRVDHQINEAHKISFIMSRESDSGTVPGTYPTAATGSAIARPSTYVAAWVATLSPTVLNEIRFGRQATGEDDRSGAFQGCCTGTSVTDSTAAAKQAFALYPQANGYPMCVALASAASSACVGGGQFGDILGFNTASDKSATSPLYQITENLSWNKGTHSFKGGFQAMSAWSNAWNMTAHSLVEATMGQGNFPVTRITSTNFAGLNSNDATSAQNLLNDLSGSIGSLTQGFVINSPTQANWSDYKDDFRRFRNFRQDDWSMFFKDTWQATRSLTLNYGVRYDRFGSDYEQHGIGGVAKGGQAGIFGISGTDFSAMWNPGASGGSLTQVQLVGPHSPNPDKKMFPTDWNNIAPSFGFSWKLPRIDRTVLRTGYGVNYLGNFTEFALDRGFGNEPGTALVRAATPTSYTNFATAGSALPLSTLGTQPLSAVPLTDRTGTFLTFTDNRRTPYVQNWNLSIERELARNLTLEVAYVGNKGTKLFQPIELNNPNIFAAWNGSETLLNAFTVTQAGGHAPLFDSLLKGVNFGSAIGTVDGVNLTGSQALRRFATTNTWLANGSIAEFGVWLNQTNSFTGQNGGLLRVNKFPENFLVVNPQFQSAQLYGNNDSGTYHSMEVKLTRRLARGFSSEFTYNWSKAMGNAVSGPTGRSEQGIVAVDPRNLRRNWGLLPFDRRQAIQAHGTWDLPVGPGRALLSGARNWVQQVAGGWQVSGILSRISGDPLNVTSPIRSVGYAPQDLATTASNLSFPDMAGSLPKNFGNVQVGNGFVQYFQGLSIKPAPAAQFGSDPDNLKVRNTNQIVVDSSGNTVFQNPQPGTVGNLGLAYFQGPAQFNLDMALMKRIKMKESSSFTIRADAINVLNKPQWGDPNLNINSASFGRITTATGARTVTINARIDF